MATYKTYQGSRLDLEFYQGKSVIDYDIEVLTDGGSDYDLSTYESVLFDVKYRRGGEQIVSLTNTILDNFIYVDLTLEQSESLQRRDYWYECYGVIGDDKELIVFGLLRGI